MRLGFFTAIFPDLPLIQVLGFAAQSNFSCVEIACWPRGKAERKYAGITHIDVAALTQTQAEDVNALCAKYGIRISALGYYPNPLDPDPAVSKAAVEHFKKVVRSARRLGLENANTFV